MPFKLKSIHNLNPFNDKSIQRLEIQLYLLINPFSFVVQFCGIISNGRYRYLSQLHSFRNICITYFVIQIGKEASLELARFINFEDGLASRFFVLRLLGSLLSGTFFVFIYVLVFFVLLLVVFIVVFAEFVVVKVDTEGLLSFLEGAEIKVVC